MGAESKIQWTHHTLNTWWGCTKVSDGCTNCYADTFAKRVGHGKRLAQIWGPRADRKIASETVWREPLKWDRLAALAGERHRVFCASMADVGEDRPDLVAPRARLARLIESTPNLDYLLLTKRPEDFVRLFRDAGWTGAWPSNVWAGTTCEDQKRADERLPHLLKVPARVHFVSYEPALGPVDFSMFVGSLDWIIVGGESGGGARPFDVEWGRSVLKQCRGTRTAVFFKQFGAKPFDSSLRDIVDVHGVAWRGAPIAEATDMARRYAGGEAVVHRPKLKDAKGGDWNEWSAELRVREYPQ